MHLGKMKMGVDEPGHQQMRPMIDNLCFRIILFDVVKLSTGHNQSALDEDCAVLVVDESVCVVFALRFPDKGKDAASKYFC